MVEVLCVQYVTSYQVEPSCSLGLIFPHSGHMFSPPVLACVSVLGTSHLGSWLLVFQLFSNDPSFSALFVVFHSLTTAVFPYYRFSFSGVPSFSPIFTFSSAVSRTFSGLRSK